MTEHASGRLRMVHRLVAGVAAALLLVSALLVPEPSADCLGWCRIDAVLLIAFAVLLGWPAVAPDRWLAGTVPAALLVAAAALMLSTTVQGPAMRVIPWVAALAMLGHWAVWRIGRARRAPPGGR